MTPIAPAVVVAVFDDTGARASRPVLEQLARVAAPGDLAVCLHTRPDASDYAAVELVRSLGLRLWWGLPTDGVARIWRQQGADAAIAMLRTWLARLPPWAPEVICIDGEGAWKPLAGDPPSGLGELAKASIAAVRETLPGALVSWTSYDHPLWHRLPWEAILGPEGVDLHAPQIYAAPRSGVGDRHDAAARMTTVAEQWSKLCDAHPTIRRELTPGGSRCTPYGQIHSVTTAAAAMVLDSADTCRAWALPTRSDAEGVRALQALLSARRDAGRSAGAIARWQTAHGLVADGLAGRETLRAMGL